MTTDELFKQDIGYLAALGIGPVKIYHYGLIIEIIFEI